jgi:hypothetical protein
MTATAATTDTGSYRTVSGVPIRFIVGGLVRFRVCTLRASWLRRVIDDPSAGTKNGQ